MKLMTNDKLLLRLIKIIDAFEFQLNMYKDTFGHDGILQEEFMDGEVQLLFDLIEEVGGLDKEDDRVGEILFDKELTSEGKFKKLKGLSKRLNHIRIKSYPPFTP